MIKKYGYALFIFAIIAAGIAIGQLTRDSKAKQSQLAGAPGLVSIDPQAESRADAGKKKLVLNGSSVSCGVERAAVKHLTDGFKLPTLLTVASIDTLVNLAAPPVVASSPRFTNVGPNSLPETTLIELRNVHVIAAKQEADSDLHIIVATPAGAELNVEAPAAACDSSSPYAAQLAATRAAIDKAMGNVSSSGYTAENVTATIEGVLFWDVLHGQRGAPNGVELHPATYFSTGSAPPPPPPPTPTTVPTTTTTPTPKPRTDCQRWPGRHYFHHVYHRDCQPNWYKTR